MDIRDDEIDLVRRALYFMADRREYDCGKLERRLRNWTEAQETERPGHRERLQFMLAKNREVVIRLRRILQREGSAA
jgi:hypothetical protein